MALTHRNGDACDFESPTSASSVIRAERSNLAGQGRKPLVGADFRHNFRHSESVLLRFIAQSIRTRALPCLASLGLVGLLAGCARSPEDLRQQRAENVRVCAMFLKTAKDGADSLQRLRLSVEDGWSGYSRVICVRALMRDTMPAAPVAVVP